MSDINGIDTSGLHDDTPRINAILARYTCEPPSMVAAVAEAEA